jgi:hypothetical protein
MHIYETILQEPLYDTEQLLPGFSRYAILQTCHQIRNEAHAIACATSTFHLGDPYDCYNPGRFAILHAWLPKKSPARKYGALIRDRGDRPMTIMGNLEAHAKALEQYHPELQRKLDLIPFAQTLQSISFSIDEDGWSKGKRRFDYPEKSLFAEERFMIPLALLRITKITFYILPSKAKRWPNYAKWQPVLSTLAALPGMIETLTHVQCLGSSRWGHLSILRDEFESWACGSASRIMVGQYLVYKIGIVHNPDVKFDSQKRLSLSMWNGWFLPNYFLLHDYDGKDEQTAKTVEFTIASFEEMREVADKGRSL